MSRPIDAMIIGAQKAGTTSLHKYVSQHPALHSHFQMELTYFVDDSEYKSGYQRAHTRYFDNCQSEQKIIGKNAGLMYNPTAIKRLYDHNPDIKLIVCLRHPVRRAYSSYWYMRRTGWETYKTFEEAIAADDSRFKGNILQARACAYLYLSEYVTHVRNILSIFPSEQLLILLTEDIKNNPVSVCQEIFQFLEIESNVSIETKERHNTAAMPRMAFLTQMLSYKNPIKKLIKSWFLSDASADKLKRNLKKMNEYEFTPPPINPSIASKLIEHFKPYNDELSAFLKRDLQHWNHF